MSHLFFALIFFTLGHTSAKAHDLYRNITPHWKLSKTQKKYLRGYKIISTSIAQSREQNQQSLDFKIAAMHKDTCNKVLSKLSVYENYNKYSDFITKSLYLEKSQEVYFRLESSLLPVNMSLRFKLPRITKAGLYPFTFDTGYFKGLKGLISIFEYKNQCLFFTRAYWLGKDTGFPDTVIEIFSEALSKKVMEKLFRIASY